MAITYTWKLTGLKKTNAANLNSVVVGTNWILTGTDEDGNSGTFCGASPFEILNVDPNNFIDFNNLTEETVLGWIKPQVTGGYWDHVTEKIQEQIDKKKNPVVEVSESDLPWIPAANTANT